MILVANGCSHTAGSEIESPLQSYCFEKAWPKKLSDKLGMSHVNLAFSGASCERVVRTSIEKLHLLKQQPSYNPSQIFFVVMWPDIWRTELYETEKNEGGFFDDGWSPMVSGNDEVYKNQFSRSAYFYYKSWVIRINQHQESVRWYNNLLLLQNILISHKIKYFFYQASQSLPSTTLTQYTSLINHKRFPTLNVRELNYCTLLDSKGFSHAPNSKYGHYGEDAHEWFSDYIFNIINDNKLL